MRREREERATEAGVLAEVMQQAVEAKRVRPQQFSLLMVRRPPPQGLQPCAVQPVTVCSAACNRVQCSL